MPQTKYNNALEELKKKLTEKPNVRTRGLYEVPKRPDICTAVVVEVQDPETYDFIEVDFEPITPEQSEDADLMLRITDAMRTGVLKELPGTVGPESPRLPRKGRQSFAQSNENVAYIRFED